jgi:hypothetical protein
MRGMEWLPLVPEASWKSGAVPAQRRLLVRFRTDTGCAAVHRIQTTTGSLPFRQTAQKTKLRRLVPSATNQRGAILER